MIQWIIGEVPYLVSKVCVQTVAYGCAFLYFTPSYRGPAISLSRFRSCFASIHRTEPEMERIMREVVRAYPPV